MNTRAIAAILLATLVACEGMPVKLGTPVAGPIPAGESRELSAEACGFQLLLVIPIQINGRLQRAYRQIEIQALGDFITDVRVEERWVYAFVGTVYCTGVQARAIRRA